MKMREGREGGREGGREKGERERENREKEVPKANYCGHLHVRMAGIVFSRTR